MANIERECPNCGGDGSVEYFAPLAPDDAPAEFITCPVCEGDTKVVRASTYRGAVEDRDRYREQAQRFRTIMASASEFSSVECRQMIRDALRGQ